MTPIKQFAYEQRIKAASRKIAELEADPILYPPERHDQVREELIRAAADYGRALLKDEARVERARSAARRRLNETVERERNRGGHGEGI